MKNMKSTKKKRNQDVQLRLDCLAASLLHVLHGENLLKISTYGFFASDSDFTGASSEACGEKVALMVRPRSLVRGEAS